MLLDRLANRVSGPSEEQLRTGGSSLWGEVRNAAGQRRTAKLRTADGYRLTADGTIMAVQYLLTNASSVGTTRRACPPRPALRRTIARVDFHPRRVAERGSFCTVSATVFELARRYEDEESSYGGRYCGLLFVVTSFAALAASAFEGVWKVKDTAGHPFEITLSSDGAAKATRGEGMTGTWKEEGNSAVITWNTAGRRR